MKRHYSLTIAALIILAVVAGVLVHTHGQNGPLVTAVQAQTPTPPVAVQTTRPDRRSVSRLIALPGDLHPIEEATVYAKVPGYLEHIYVDKGDRVKAGQLLAEIQAPELQADRE